MAGNFRVLLFVPIPCNGRFSYWNSNLDIIWIPWLKFTGGLFLIQQQPVT